MYTAIPDGLNKGDQVIVDSDKETVFYYYVKTAEHNVGEIAIIDDPDNLDYVNENKSFK